MLHVVFEHCVYGCEFSLTCWKYPYLLHALAVPHASQVDFRLCHSVAVPVSFLSGCRKERVHGLPGSVVWCSSRSLFLLQWLSDSEVAVPVNLYDSKSERTPGINEDLQQHEAKAHIPYYAEWLERIFDTTVVFFKGWNHYSSNLLPYNAISVEVRNVEGVSIWREAGGTTDNQK